MKNIKRSIPKKNYLYLVVLLISVVLLTLYIFKLTNNINMKKIEKSYLADYINEVKVNELLEVIKEPSSELFIFVTKTNDEKVYKLEKDLKKVINDHDLRDNFILVTSTENKSIDEINKILKSDIKKAPAIIYLKNGEYIKGIESNKNLLQSGDLEQLLDEYEVN